MKKYLCSFALLLLVSFLGIKATDAKIPQNKIATPAKAGEDIPFLTADQMPVFPGGETSLMKYLSENVHYPKQAVELRKEGRVIIRFVVGADGKVRNAEIVRGFDAECDAEALRVTNGMPNWIAGVKDGKNVPVYFTLPIRFMLSGKDANNVTAAPLIIIDDVVSNLTKEQLRDSIKPERIESFNILRDSAAISRYGEKGKNGVILIKLKK